MELLRTDLVLDIGNTRTKAGLFEGLRCKRATSWLNDEAQALGTFLGNVRPAYIAIGSVAAPDNGLLEEMRAIAPVLHITGETDAPLIMDYGTPGTLGVDRLANAVGAKARFPGRTILVVDLGTCITYDLVDADGTYRGGAISPGMRMRAQAMHAYSARLPLVEPAVIPEPIGTTTSSALESGIYHGIRGELQAFIEHCTHRSPGCAVVLTGGDALRFANALKNGIFALPLLTLEGLHTILEHHRAAGNLPAAGRSPSGGGAGATG